nr:ArdC-like ssDNA-binding domain-containing protein [uncultured Desulfobacter sp.]
MGKYQDKLNEFSQKVLDAVKKGDAPWQKPWKEGELLELPKNMTTDTAYKGVNVMNLAMSGYNDPRWLTFNQAKNMDCRVRKGEKSTAGFYYSPNRLEKALDENGKPIIDKDGKETMERVEKPVFNAFALFNASQVEGIEPYHQPDPSWNPEEKAEKILRSADLPMVESQLNRAFYRPDTHTIETPQKAQFEGKSEYYSMIFHELSHATQHPSMLNRERDRSSKEDRTKEELRAEISAWLICTQIGIGYEPSAQENNTAYVAGWLTALKENDRAKELGFAMKDAEKIAHYILGMDKKQAVAQEEPVKGHYIIADESLTGISENKTLVDPWGSEAAKFDTPEAALKAAISAKATMTELEDDDVSVYKITEFGDTQGPLVTTGPPIHMKGMWERNIKTSCPEDIIYGRDQVREEKSVMEVTDLAKDELAKKDMTQVVADIRSSAKQSGIKIDQDDDQNLSQSYQAGFLSGATLVNPMDSTDNSLAWNAGFKDGLGESERLETEANQAATKPQFHNATRKTYIHVPYAEKDEAKGLGAKWDKEQKSWFIAAGTDPQLFEKWMKLQENKEIDTSDLANQFRDHAAKIGVVIDNPVADGKKHRVWVEGESEKKVSGEYVLHADGRPAGYVKNYKTAEFSNFKYEGDYKLEGAFNKADQRNNGQQDNFKKAAKTAFGIYINAEKTTDHPYLEAKGLNGGKEYRVDKNNRLIVPAINPQTKKIETLQFINTDGTKQFLKDGKKSGNCYILGELDENKPILFAEGFATGKTLHDISHLPAVVCFDSNNLENVAMQIRELMPSADLFFCADNDHALKNNVGVEKAQKAAEAVGGEVIIPKFSEAGKRQGMTDFNDLSRCKMGKSRIEKQLQSKIKFLVKDKDKGMELER